MLLPPPQPARLARKQALVSALEKILPSSAILHRTADVLPYECDGLAAYRKTPMAVVLPANTTEIAHTLKVLHELQLPVVPWGAGTGLSGGALPLEDGVTLSLGRMNRIVEIDLPNRCATVQPGLSNLAISEAVRPQGFYYAPDPSSQIACSIGGNVAENSGGVHCLKYGMTTNNILGLEVVLMNGEILHLGGKGMEEEGYDFLGVLNGSEGLLGIISQVTVKLLPTPPSAQVLMAVFSSIEAAGTAVARVIEAGMIPAGMEIMDSLALEAAEDHAQAGYPRGEAAILLLEHDGSQGEVNHLMEKSIQLMSEAGATLVKVAQDEAERQRLWAGRKAAFPAIGRISPDYYCVDGTIPRKALAHVLAETQRLSASYGLRVANVFHAGDGNLHPLVLYDGNLAGELEKAEALGADILKLCVQVGGVLSGEHGIGVEKRDLMPYQFTEVELKAMQRIKCCFDPQGLLNPGKVFPTLHRCAELGKMHVHQGALPFPHLDRL